MKRNRSVGMPRMLSPIGAASALVVALGFSVTPSLGQTPKMSMGIPAIPPVFVGVQEMVAEKQGFFAKYGIDVKVRNFANGSEASRAVVAGNIDASLSPTPLVINQISNAGIGLVGIYGTEKPDYYLASTDPNATCKSVVGQPVGVDTPGGALSIALKNMLAGCGISINQVQQVALSANVPTAVAAGQLKYAVLHLDGIMAVQDQTGKSVKIITDYQAAKPVYHNMVVVALRKTLAAKRDQYVRLVAALISAERYMRDPANRSTVAKIATATGRSEKEAALALEKYIDMGFWPHDSNGITKANIEAVARDQVKAGNIRPGKIVAPYDRVVDLTIFPEALALANKNR